MSATKKIWYDENSEPPKNYIWSKGGKLFKYIDGQWKEISENGSDSDIQIVELTYDHLPATGTLSASDIEKLDSDNCLLIINGRYFYKTYGANSGFDYHEIGLTKVLGGLRSIYFTASKPDGEYTIAYTYPVEANTETQATTALENIKVGNTTYSVPLSPMIVRGTAAGDDPTSVSFTPASGSPTWAEAYDHMLNGGLVYLVPTADGEPIGVLMAIGGGPDGILGQSGEAVLAWLNPDYQGPDNPE